MTHICVTLPQWVTQHTDTITKWKTFSLFSFVLSYRRSSSMTKSAFGTWDGIALNRHQSCYLSQWWHGSLVHNMHGWKISVSWRFQSWLLKFSLPFLVKIHFQSQFIFKKKSHIYGYGKREYKGTRQKQSLIWDVKIRQWKIRYYYFTRYYDIYSQVPL